MKTRAFFCYMLMFALFALRASCYALCVVGRYASLCALRAAFMDWYGLFFSFDSHRTA